MSSDLLKGWRNLNDGIVTLFKPSSSQDLYERKVLEVIGAVPLGSFCHMCGEDATHEYNLCKICQYCFDELINAASDTTTYTFGSNKIFYCGNGKWVPRVPVGRGDYILIRKESKFVSADPEELLTAALFPSICQRSSNCKCFNCKDGYFSDSFYKNNKICETCRNEALNYFDIDLTFYLFLKVIFLEDIAKYLVLLYFKIKLRNCSRLSDRDQNI